MLVLSIHEIITPENHKFLKELSLWIEALAATTLIVYKKFFDQLNRYYVALHNNEMFLLAVNLANKISYEKRDDTYNYIIKTKLESTKDHEGV